jgi:hypothetical protein
MERKISRDFFEKKISAKFSGTLSITNGATTLATGAAFERIVEGKECNLKPIVSD